MTEYILSVGRGPQKTQFLSHFRDFLFPETNFSFNSRYFGLRLSRFRPVSIHDMHGRKFHQPCSGLTVTSVQKLEGCSLESETRLIISCNIIILNSTTIKYQYCNSPTCQGGGKESSEYFWSSNIPPKVVQICLRLNGSFFFL